MGRKQDHENGALQGDRRGKREMADVKEDTLTGECDVTKVVQV